MYAIAPYKKVPIPSNIIAFFRSAFLALFVISDLGLSASIRPSLQERQDTGDPPGTPFFYSDVNPREIHAISRRTLLNNNDQDLSSICTSPRLLPNPDLNTCLPTGTRDLTGRDFVQVRVVCRDPSLKLADQIFSVHCGKLLVHCHLS